MFVFAGASLLAQTKVITGTVTSSVAGEGVLAGVSVSVTGTTIGALTDINGKYSIPNVPASATSVTFSYIGYKKQDVQIANRTVIDVMMEPEVTVMNEVVVTAFGIKRQAKELGVATEKVDNQELTQAAVTNVVNGLTAKVSGLQINTVNNGVNPDTRITLRGNRHFLASNEALVVLDGIPVDASYLNQINPNDIDNVNVLKGASAAALYGNDASNGVLIITTKKGTSGKPVITISNTTTFESVSYMPKLQERFGSGANEDTINYPANEVFWIGRDRNTSAFTSFENEAFGPQFNGQMVMIGGILADGSYQEVKYSAVHDHVKKFFNTGITNQSDVSYSVGDDKNNFYLSAQDVNSTGTVPGDKNRRTGLRASGARTSGIFHADYTVGFTQTNTDVSGNDAFQQRPVYWQVLNTPPEIDVTNYKDIVNNKFANNNGYYNGYYMNPYWVIDHSRYNTTINNILSSVLLSLNPAKWVTLSYRLGLTYTGDQHSYYQDPLTFESYYLSDPWGCGGMASTSPYAGVSWDYLETTTILTGDFLAQFNKKIGDFTGKLIVGNSVYNNKYRYVYVGNNSIVIPDLYNVANRLGEAAVGETWLNRNSTGVFGDLTLGYKDFIFLHASARNDWDSRLTKANRSFFYPGVDMSIVLTDAIPSLKNNSVLSFAKVRGGISKTGQISLANYYATLPQFNPGLGNNSATGFPYGNQAGFSLNTTLSNPNLKPELTREIEAGLDLGFMKSRFNLSLGAYQSNTKDQTIPASISYATGYTSAYINAGELQTQGLEADLKLTPVVSVGNFTWNLTLSYTYNTSKVISIYGTLTSLPIADISYAVVGQQFPALEVTAFEKDPQGHYIVDPTTGYPIRDPALQHIGHGNPNSILGISSTFAFKGFKLNFVADYRTGNMIDNWVGNPLNFTGESWMSAWNGRQDYIIPNSVINTGTAAHPIYTPNTTVITNGNAFVAWSSSTFMNTQALYMTSAAFWKLREVSLTYDIPVKNILGGAIKAAEVGLIGRNLLMFVPRTNIWTDPEFNTETGTSNAVGYTNEYQTPPTRIWGFSIKLTF